ncbi:hypothetical protein DV736_g5891, partial [Chaetothyriales sp. CBS 134916]
MHFSILFASAPCPGSSFTLSASAPPGSSFILSTSTPPGSSFILSTSTPPGSSFILSTSAPPGSSLSPVPPPAETSSGCTGSTEPEEDEPEEDEPNCLDATQIEQILADSIYLLSNPGIYDYNTTAERLFTPGVQVVSDSLKISNGQPIDGTPFFPSRSAITNAQFDLLPIRDMDTQYYTYSCDDQTIGWRWTASGMANGHTRIAAHMLFDLVDGRLNHVYWEFNSINWVANVGIQCSVPQAS